MSRLKTLASCNRRARRRSRLATVPVQRTSAQADEMLPVARRPADGDTVAPLATPSRPSRRLSRAASRAERSRHRRRDAESRSSESRCKTPSEWRCYGTPTWRFRRRTCGSRAIASSKPKPTSTCTLQVEPSSSFSVTPPENLFFAGPGVGGYGYQPAAFSGSRPHPCSTTGPGYIIQHQYSFQSGVSGQSVNGMQYVGRASRKCAPITT